ncbi:MAG: MerR family transcriptional regulator [Vulcanimicrobiaceae bacterium]
MLIQTVARLTNLSVDTIRAWEKRYGAVRPIRTATNQRQFVPSDVERIILLREAVRHGYHISKISKLPAEQLRALLGDQSIFGESVHVLVQRLKRRVQEHEPGLLARDLVESASTRPAAEFADDVVRPLLQELASANCTDSEKLANLLLFASTLTCVSGSLMARYERGGVPRCAFLTLPGERHSIAAILASLVAAESGFTSVFLGTEIAASRAIALARVLNLSGIGIHTSVRSRLTKPAIEEIKNALPQTRVWVGGSSARALGIADSVTSMRHFAEELRNQSSVPEFSSA